jgi:large subunit ribosomal protein L35
MQKTRKAVKKRFKITGTGKVLRNTAGRRHLAGSKKSKKTRTSRRLKVADVTDNYRVISNLPFSH